MKVQWLLLVFCGVGSFNQFLGIMYVEVFLGVCGVFQMIEGFYGVGQIFFELILFGVLVVIGGLLFGKLVVGE